MSVPSPRFSSCVPTRPVRLFEADEEELDHIAILLGAIGRGPVPQIVVDNGDRPSLPSKRDFSLLVPLIEAVVVVAAGDNAGGAALDWRVLRIVKGHRPAQPVVSPAPAILVQPLPFRTRLIEMAETMRMQIVPRPQDTGQGSRHLGLVEHLLQVGDAGQ